MDGVHISTEQHSFGASDAFLDMKCEKPAEYSDVLKRTDNILSTKQPNNANRIEKGSTKILDCSQMPRNSSEDKENYSSSHINEKIRGLGDFSTQKFDNLAEDPPEGKFSQNGTDLHTGNLNIAPKDQNSSSSSSSEIMIRKRNSTDPGKHPCKLCHQSFVDRFLLIRHMKMHETDKFTCKVCEETFPDNSALNRHLTLHFKEWFTYCSYCCTMFTDDSDYKTHLSQHQTDLPYMCNICNTQYEDKESVRKHNASSHDRPYKCGTCSQYFPVKSYLESHIRTHVNKRPFKCPYCSKAFNHNFNLTKHIRRHTGERPYSCGVCNKKFSQKNSLNRHETIHLRESIRNINKKQTIQEDGAPEKEEPVNSEERNTDVIYNVNKKIALIKDEDRDSGELPSTHPKSDHANQTSKAHTSNRKVPQHMKDRTTSVHTPTSHKQQTKVNKNIRKENTRNPDQTSLTQTNLNQMSATELLRQQQLYLAHMYQLQQGNVSTCGPWNFSPAVEQSTQKQLEQNAYLLSYFQQLQMYYNAMAIQIGSEHFKALHNFGTDIHLGSQKTPLWNIGAGLNDEDRTGVQDSEEEEVMDLSSKNDNPYQ